jgi:hypothetical protein
MKTLRQTPAFTARPAKRPGKVTITARDRESRPLQRTVRSRTWAQLNAYPDDTFDAACVWDLGIGIFQKTA